ncbi:hypothetical protein Hanom_Chr08g00704251 [Helianthus anomalus]
MFSFSFKYCECHHEVSVNPGDAGFCAENSKVSESLLLMKFYSSPEALRHLHSGDEFDLPFELSNGSSSLSQKLLFN